MFRAIPGSVVFSRWCCGSLFGLLVLSLPCLGRFSAGQFPPFRLRYPCGLCRFSLVVFVALQFGTVLFVAVFVALRFGTVLFVFVFVALRFGTVLFVVVFVALRFGTVLFVVVFVALRFGTVLFVVVFVALRVRTVLFVVVLVALSCWAVLSIIVAGASSYGAVLSRCRSQCPVGLRPGPPLVDSVRFHVTDGFIYQSKRIITFSHTRGAPRI